MAVDELKHESPGMAVPRLFVGNYDLQGKVAEGGMGTVYRGRHRVTGAIVAVKVVPPHVASNPIYLKRFEKEYSAAKVLNHPNIVRALDFGWEGDTPYLVMEFVEGESLGQRLEREHLLSEAEAVRIIAQVAEGLDSAHASGIVHRDVKPDNILLTPDGTAKLTDLGLVKDPDMELNLTRTGRGLGTPHFMAPEQFRNAKHADARCDIYSLGATMYMMVTGELPFQSTGPLDAWMKKVRNEIVPPGQLASDLSTRADRAIRRAMSVEPAHRPATCREFVEALQDDTATLVGEDGETAVATVWHILYSDAKGVIHITPETTEGVRRVLKDGSLGDPDRLRIGATSLGPFQRADQYIEFGGSAGTASTETADEHPTVETETTRIPKAAPAGPLIDLGVGRRSFDWLAWLTLIVLGAAAAVIGYSVLPGLRWRWF